MLSEGQQVDRYRILRLIGSGGMGFVYLAEDPRIGQQVAIKVIRAEASSDVHRYEEAARLFHREVKAITKLDHPHILPLFDYGEEHFGNMTLIYLVMPYRPEGSLLDWLRRSSPPNSLSPEQVAHTVKQAAGALQHAHIRQIIHQDVKPSNFLMHYREETPAFPDVLLADFGIARFATATYLWRQAIAKDTNDAEALIYLEDLRVLESGQPYLTIVIGTTLTGSGLATGQANLRGVFLAQEEYNSKQMLPGGVQVYLLIANSGSDPTWATFVAKQIALLSQTDKTIVGVMGWTLAAAHIPMVSNTGTDELTGRSTYSFRIVASGATQGSLGAQALEKIFHAKRVVLFTDPQDD